MWLTVYYNLFKSQNKIYSCDFWSLGDLSEMCTSYKEQEPSSPNIVSVAFYSFYDIPKMWDEIGIVIHAPLLILAWNSFSFICANCSCITMILSLCVTLKSFIVVLWRGNAHAVLKVGLVEEGIYLLLAYYYSLEGEQSVCLASTSFPNIYHQHWQNI